MCADVGLRFFFSSRRRHTRSKRDWSSDVCSSDLHVTAGTRSETVTTVFRPATSARRYKMNCQEIEALRQAYADRELDLVRTTEIERSEERRVGKECRPRRWGDECEENNDIAQLKR